MAQEAIDQVAAVKASLELMITENAEIHEYFKDLLEKVSELDDKPPEARRERFKDLVSMGAFRFNGLDIRRFAQGQHAPLPPPLFLNRTRRRLKNTLTLVEEFARRELFGEAGALQDQLQQLADRPVDEENSNEVLSFKGRVDELRASPLFRTYLETKTRFIRQDMELRTDAEYLAAKESVEEGEESFRQRGQDLSELSRHIEAGTVDLDEAQARLDAMSLETAKSAAAADPPDKGDAE